MEKTLFEKIIDREIPAQIIYEDEYTVAFLDIAPVNPGHTLVIPRHPYRSVLETPDDVVAHIMSTAKKVAQTLQKSLGAEGINITFNTEPAAGQVIFHTHAHVIPRYQNDGHALWKQSPYPEGVWEKMGERLRQTLER